MFKDIVLGSLSFLALPNDRAVILMYHSVSDTPNYFSAVSPKMFERQMAYLARTEKSVITLTELVRRLKGGEPLGGSVAITFDDGYRDNYTNALPILQKYAFPATVFVDTDLVGRADKRGLMRLTVAEMQELECAGVEIQPHSKAHPRLGDLEVNRARDEVLGSKQQLESWLGKRANIFAYPYGSYNNNTEQIVREGGFDAAVTVREGTVQKNTDLYHLPRNSVDHSITFAQFKGKLTRAVDVYERIKSTKV
ncbi:MAG: polysaccharide deacetylase family protein [Patescibacteria group bacterium]|nr:polysaccharide deacetylase family protein [Patescibacteria group bacterium]